MFYAPPPPEPTATVAIVYKQASGGDETPTAPPWEQDSGAYTSDSTNFFALRQNVPFFGRTHDETSSSGGSEQTTNCDSDGAPVEAVRTRDARIALLARRYEGSKSIEDDARLEILTARLRRLMPRVEPQDLAKVQGVIDDVESMVSEVEAIRHKFGT